jgi:hypothetical protein
MPSPKRSRKKEESDMGKMALGLAAVIAAGCITAPATAGTPEEPFVGIPNANPTLGTSGLQVGGGAGFGGQLADRRHGSSGGGVWVNGGEWARYNNPSFQSDSYNDWWHDRPDRAYPAWVRNNQNCARQWYAGNTLRC